MIVFNDKGYLVPDSVIRISLNDFKQTFVAQDSARRLIYEELLKFNESLL